MTPEEAKEKLKKLSDLDSYIANMQWARSLMEDSLGHRRGVTIEMVNRGQGPNCVIGLVASEALFEVMLPKVNKIIEDLQEEKNIVWYGEEARKTEGRVLEL